jgi:uncharacterized protein (TIGR03435 family)
MKISVRSFPTRLLIVLTALAALAQGQAVRPTYEVATIKLNESDKGSRGLQEDKAQAVFTSIPLKRLIQWAYKVYPFQVSGPGWLEDVHFDISAKYPPDLRDEERPLMLRTLLEDRLKLVIHRESREMQGYSLVIAKGGFKLKTVEPGAPVTGSLGSMSPSLNLQGGFRRSILVAKKASIASLADLMTRVRDGMVIDKTGLSGVYDFELRWNNDDNNPIPSDGNSFPFLFTALQETLGLRLQAEKVPVEMIVVDHVARDPTEN